ncbi:MAG: hypothetical protein O2871_03640 [bacterium]|nr:hypothetical protein [bacterium]
MVIPLWAKTVTPFSKVITLIIFITFPIFGFIFGMKYQESITESTDTQEKVENVCSAIPDEVSTNKEHYDMVIGPFWSPDCKYIVWSLWRSGTSYLGDDPEIIKKIMDHRWTLADKEGVFLYTISTKEVIRVYTPKRAYELIGFDRFLGNNTINFTADGKEYTYNIDQKNLTLIRELN